MREGKIEKYPRSNLELRFKNKVYAGFKTAGVLAGSVLIYGLFGKEIPEPVQNLSGIISLVGLFSGGNFGNGTVDAYKHYIKRFRESGRLPDFSELALSDEYCVRLGYELARKDIKRGRVKK